MLAGSFSSATPFAVSSSTGYVVVGLPQQAERRRAARCSRAFGDRRVRSRPNVLSSSWPRATHLLARLPAQHVGDVRRAEALADARDAREDLARERAPGRRPTRARRGSSRRRRSRSRRDGLAEIGDQVTVPAADAGGVALHVAQQRRARVGELAVPLEHDAPLQEVGASSRSARTRLRGRRGRRGPTSCW